jgi:uncharacterized protein
MEGFGSTAQVHTSRLLSLSQDLPMAIIIVDTAEAVERFLPQIDDLVGDGVVLVDDVQVYRPGAGSPGSQGRAPGDATA